MDEKTELEGLLAQQKKIVINRPQEPGVYNHLLKWPAAAGFKGVCSTPIDESGACRPVYFSSMEEIPQNSYLALISDARGYTLFVSLSHAGHLATLQGHAQGIVVHIESSLTASKPALLVLQGDDVYQMISEAMKLSLELTGGVGHAVENKLPAPTWFEYLGWEPAHKPEEPASHESILNTIWSLHQNGIFPSFVIINESWQYTKKRALAGFDADPDRFPSGLKGVVQDLSRIGIKHVGIWHGIMGARNGVDEALAQKYQLPSDGLNRFYLGTDLGKTFQFYHDYYEHLRQQGITFTKVGDQGAPKIFCTLNSDSTGLIKNLQSAIQAASSVHFDSFHFNTECLCHGNIFYWGNSRIASAAGPAGNLNLVEQPESIRNHLSNGLWLQHLMLPDLNSWETTGPYKELFAMLHALSGSVNVINDMAGNHKKAILKKMILPSGKLMPADKPLTLCEDSIFTDPLKTDKIYKAFTYKGNCAIFALFNLNSFRKTLHGQLSAEEAKEIEGDFFAVHSHQKGFLGVAAKKENFPISLKPGQSDILTFSPIKHGSAVFGCHSFYLPPGPLIDVDIEEDSIHIAMQVSGPLLLYTEKPILEIRRNGQTVPWEQDSRRNTLSIDSTSVIIETNASYTILFES